MYLLFIIFFACVSHAGSFKRILIFGDSIADVGGGYKLAESLNVSRVPPTHLYFDHHWSNGPLWSDYVAQELLLEQKNYAVGGATLGLENALQSFGASLGGIQQEIARFADEYKYINKKTITILEGGYNDIILEIILRSSIAENTLENMLARTEQRILELIDLGAKPLVVWNLFDATTAPIFNAPPFIVFAAKARQIIKDFNARLPVLIADINNKKGGDIIHIFDANKAFEKTLLELQNNGIDISVFTVTILPSIPLSFSVVGPFDFQTVWYDTVHPGTYFWQKFAPQLINFIKYNL